MPDLPDQSSLSDSPTEQSGAVERSISSPDPPAAIARAEPTHEDQSAGRAKVENYQLDTASLSIDPRSIKWSVMGGSTVLAGRDIKVQQNYFGEARKSEAELREFFIQSVKHREDFIGDFLKQALRQAESTFRMSVAFMVAGGLVVLIAGVLTLMNSSGSVKHTAALVSGLGGLIVGASGAAFSLKADKSRKHLADQAERIHSEVLDERRFTQVADLLSGIRNPDVNDQARAALALRILDRDAATAPETGRTTDTEEPAN